MNAQPSIPSLPPPPNLTFGPDPELPGFEAATVPLAGDDPSLVATLVRRRADPPAPRAVLYVHGYLDYFFQAHLAQAFTARGWDFYALDLRRYGRSLRPGQPPNACDDLREYYEELDLAVAHIRADGHTRLVLHGHSTGGLVTSLYLHDRAGAGAGEALVLNSPFFGMNVRGPYRLLPIAVAAARFWPHLALMPALPMLYPKSVHADHHGEWRFRTDWKPIGGFPVYAGWLRAIGEGQRRVRAGLDIRCPVLLLHSDRSVWALKWTDALLRGDGVLDVADMKRHGPGLGHDVTLIEIEGGMHDLVLSAESVREEYLAQVFAWLDERFPAATSRG